MRRTLAMGALVLFLCCMGCATGGKPPPPDARLEEARKALDEGRRLRTAGKYAEAIPLAERALQLREAALGEKHPEVASGLDLLGDIHVRQGSYARAEPLLTRALAIREAALGKEHPDVAASLYTLGKLYLERGLYKQARQLLERALAIQEKSLGKEHPDVAASLHGLATGYRLKGLLEQAEPLYERAIAIREAALGKNHPDIAASLNGLASVHADQGHLARAEPLYERAIAIREAALGKNHPDVAASLNGLASVHESQGLYARAEALHERALSIREAALGRNHPDVAASLNNLAIVYLSQGRYARAEPLLERALAIWELALGKSHPYVSAALNGLASAYINQGQHERAEPLLQRALAAQEATLGPSHPNVAVTLKNLARIYTEQGAYSRAEPLLERALAIREAALGKDHPDVASALTGLALLYMSQGLYARAIPLNERALAIWEAAEHPSVGVALTNLAYCYKEQRLYEKAGPLYERALAVNEVALGPADPNIVLLLNRFAQFRLAQGRLAEALLLLERAFATSEAALRQELFGFSEESLASLLDHLRSDEERLYALTRAHPDDERVRRLALAAALLRKGRSLEEIADTSRVILRGMSEEDRKSFERLRTLRAQLATMSLRGPGPLEPAEYQRRLAELAGQSDALEADLARRSASLRAIATLPSPAEVVDRVAASLPKGGALVELVAYDDTPLFPAPGMIEAKLPSQPRYLALLLFPNGRSRAVDLGPAAPIDQAAARLRDALAQREVAYQGPARALDALAFRPLLARLGGARRFFLAPDGQLALVPFEAFHDGRRFRIDSFDFSYITSGRDLLPRPDALSPARSVVVLADPDFGAPAAASPQPAATAAERSSSVERFFRDLNMDVADQPWVPLPGTRREAEAIQRLLPEARLFLGADASKERLLHLTAPGILHVATHGFFLGESAAPRGTRAVTVSGPLGGEAPASSLPDPLLRSGLVLAGARALLNPPGEPASRRLEDSLVTALELSGLDLWGTQLVVLSACDTGRGNVRPGQGVYGMRRALVVAGAETLVMSLWRVNDETTHTLMESYYRNLLAGKGRTTALREAMLALRRTRPHPHFWAPFVAVGRDAPLAGLQLPPR